MNRTWIALIAAAFLAACGSSSESSDLGPSDLGPSDLGPSDLGPSDPGPSLDTPADAVDVPDAVDPGTPDVPTTPDADVPAPGDAVDDVFVPEIPDVVQPFPARSLPFEYTREADGDPIPETDTTAFTKSVTGLWKQIDWARWVLRTSMGVDPSTGKADYLAWHNDQNVVKAGDTLTFREPGGEHNMWIPGSKVLSSAIGGYLLTGDWTWAKLTEQYCKGLTAVVKGFVWDENDPAPWLMARAVFPMDHSFTLDADTWKDDGRKKVVEFHQTYVDEAGWNAQKFAWPHNPTWGSMYVTNMRSKDDVRAIVRTTTFLYYVVQDAQDAFVKTACAETLETMKNFNKDIVDNDYFIRTKGPDGVAYRIPCTGEGGQDLGSYSCYTSMDPLNECCARTATDYIAYGEKRTPEDCGGCIGSVYDEFASVAHFYNIPIVWDYHMAAVGNALVNGDALAAWYLLDGLRKRVERYMDPASEDPWVTHHDWKKELAVMLVQCASMGLPLTAREARLVQQQWQGAVTEFSAFPNWDPWSASIPDGPVQVRPGASSAAVDIEAVTTFLEYCNSPFRNPAGAQFIDCDVVRDITKWGL